MNDAISQATKGMKMVFASRLRTLWNDIPP